ncbi:hypothetical protein V502_06974 [Pseudogymnoascus sp. VKM F-4520 (FW-2644)]|nr:hypothetical protein V502_06974 [Pseudogymnoascus sp. VKM F-4520 (FW-2644)]
MIEPLMDPQPPPLRTRKRRNPGRSKKGCLTCREKRVKCDEGRPSCNRCTRLHFVCSAPDPDSVPPFVKCRRRAFISQKSLDQNMTPLRELYPSPSHTYPRDDLYYSYDSSSPATSQGPAAETVNGDAGFHQLSGNVFTGLTHVSAAHVNGVIDALASDDGFMDLWTSQLQHISNDASEIQPVVRQCHDYSNDWAAAFATIGAPDLPDGSDAWSHASIQDIDMHYSASTPFPLPKLISLCSIQLSNSITLTPKDHNALIYYQSDIGPCQTTKSPRWSFSALLLRLALRSTMTMHLLLAVSIYDLSTAQNAPGNLQAASAHFKEGTRMFIEIITYGSAED